jgi:hypothetical protein
MVPSPHQDGFNLLTIGASLRALSSGAVYRASHRRFNPLTTGASLPTWVFP